MSIYTKRTYTKIAQGMLGLIVLALVIAFSWWLSGYVSENSEMRELIQRFGYLGVFLISIISGFNVVVPLPAISFLPVLTEAGLNFWLSIVVITLGMTLGDGLGYLIGYMGRKFSDIEHTYVFKKLQRIKERRVWLPIVVMVVYAALAPLPNEILVIPLAIMGYKFKHILPAVFMGNLVFNTLAAFGLSNLFSIL